MHQPIGQNMTKEPISIAPDVSLQDAQEIFRSWGMRHLPITDKNGLVGIISDRDIYRAIALGKSMKSEVRAAMSTAPYSVTKSTPVSKVAKTMADNKFGCAVVVDDNKTVLGIFTTTDALNILASLLHEPDEANYRVISIEEYMQRYRKAL